jgi:hypothetical protein
MGYLSIADQIADQLLDMGGNSLIPDEMRNTVFTRVDTSFAL